ncbi:MAG: hypothetical protein IPL52_11765 [Flavobacteriales bacterium]|nr:hypothetical protein [Flavobacteriales bacterium]
MFSFSKRKWYQWLYILGGLLCIVVGVAVKDGGIVNTLIWVFVGVIGIWSGTMPNKPKDHS